jgi:hypothetical protein
VSAPPLVLRRRSKLRKAVNIALFCITLVLAVIVALLILARFAGGWGVPYFSTTTDRGSRCVNTFTGFDCPSLTAADIGYFGDVELPPGTQVVSSHYHSTHDYQLEAVLEIPPASASDGLKALEDSYGKCVKNHPSPLTEPGLKSLCILANDQDTTETGVPDSRVFVVATALRADKTRVVNLSVRSR